MTYRVLRLAVVAGAALALSGCGTMGQRVLTNLEGCERQYDGVVSVGLGAGFSGTVRIRCPAARPIAEGEAQTEVVTVGEATP